MNIFSFCAFYLVAALALSGDAVTRNTEVGHELVWSGEGITVFKVELGGNERTSIRHHRTLLTIPLTPHSVLEYNDSFHQLTWELREGISLTQQGRGHSVSNPGQDTYVQLEIEFAAEKPILLPPRFSPGVKEQAFALPGFRLGRHVLQSGETLNLTDCKGPLFFMAAARVSTPRVPGIMSLMPGDAMDAADPIHNESAAPLSILSVCPSATSLARSSK